MARVVSSLDVLASAIRDSAKDLAVAALAEHLLPGIEVRIYQARDHAWCASVLLDPSCTRRPPPEATGLSSTPGRTAGGTT